MSGKNLQTGYWHVAGEDFYSKVEAVMYATSQKADVKYIFNNSTFDNIDWSIEPSLSLRDLYYLRAQQLRDKYRKIVLFYSAGSDSHTALLAFLRQNIHIDEIVFYRADGTGVDKQESVFNIEISTVGIGVIEECLKKGIKITELNLVDAVEEAFPDEDWIFNFNEERPVPTAPLRNVLFKKWFYDNGFDQRDCAIYGLEKPRLFFQDGYWCSGFLDEALRNFNHPATHKQDYEGPVYEFFFTTPDMPEIVVKQVHDLIRHFQKMEREDPIFYDIVKDQVLTRSDDFKRTVFFPIANEVLYDGFWKEGEIFSLGKGPPTPGALFYFKDGWLYNPNSKYQTQRMHWYKGLVAAEGYIDARFKNEGSMIKGDLMGIYSNTYKVKPV